MVTAAVAAARLSLWEAMCEFVRVRVRERDIVPTVAGVAVASPRAEELFNSVGREEE